MSTAQQSDEFLRDAKGRLVPVELVKPIDRTRDQLVSIIVAKAKNLREQIGAFKAEVFADIAAFIELSAEQYEVKLGGSKGNVTLTSYDGRFKIVRQIADHLAFDERLQAAHELISQCITEWSAGARSEIQALVNDAFQVDKQGHINTARVLGLRRLDIRDEKWQRAMKAIADSVQVTGSKPYVRVYERIGDSDQFQAIALDVAGA